MSCSRITKSMANRIDVPYDLAWPIVQEFFSELESELRDGKDVRVPNLGLFKWVWERPRSGVSVITGKKWHHPPKKRLKWYPASTLKGGRSG